MKKVYGVKILLKYIAETETIFEESVILVETEKVDEIKDKVICYLNRLNQGQEEEDVAMLVEILDYWEIVEDFPCSVDLKEVYCRFLNKNELILN